ncbi:MAG: hypothetical protein HY046_04010 [Acidobacteria bacterium]|nr:hypothetical protein [Acidobacteriota bacterium]
MRQMDCGKWAATAAVFVFLGFATPAQQTARRVNFHPTHYTVTAMLTPGTHQLSAKAVVDYVADFPSGVVEFELHPNLRINSITSSDGKIVTVDRDSETPLHVRATLPSAVNSGDKVTLTVDYAGGLSGDENSPTKGVMLAYIGDEGCFLLQAARWFPLSGYPSERFAYTFNIIVPDSMAVVGTGKSQAPSIYQDAPPPTAAPATAPAKKGTRATRPAPEPVTTTPLPPPPTTPPTTPAAMAVKVNRIQYTFQSGTPEAGGTFVAGEIQLTPVQAEGLTIPVYTRAASASTAKVYGETAARVVGALSDQIGSLMNPEFTIVQMPDGGVAAYAAPGLLLINQRNWTARPNDRMLARLAASQWWEFGVSPATANDVWLSDGLARFSEALYLESSGENASQRALDDFAVGTLMYESVAPIAQAGRLEPFSSEYRSIVVNKGAMIFHMLRGQIGENAFHSTLRSYYSQFKGKTARLEDFQKIAQNEAQRAAAAVPPPPPGGAGNGVNERAQFVINTNLMPFFTQWLRSTGIPEFKLEYVVYRTSKGFRTIGKIKQNMDTFVMPVDVRIDTLGNPEFNTIQVVGTESDFSIETFGRPKPGGITIDPRNKLLKSSPSLRVRTLIARGEELAEVGKYYEATSQYQAALEVQKNNSLASFRMGEAAFYMKNYQSAANAFRDSLVGDLDLSYKWVEVWGHIYLGKIFDIGGQRERALNEYRRAKDLNDDTGGAQAEADKYIAKPFEEGAKN